MGMGLGLGIGLASTLTGGGVPSWVTEGAALDLDFVNDRYWPSADISGNHTRASTALMADASGVYQSFASGALRQIDGVGALLEGAATNKCENFNANPDASLTSLVNEGTGTLSRELDVAALADAGLSSICTSGYVFKYDNTGQAGTTVAFAGLTGNTNKHSSQVRVRGSGVANLRLNAVPLNSNTTLTSAYQTIKEENVTPSASNRPTRLVIGANAVVFFILNQLEEASFASSPIITAGSAATRAADALTFDLGATAHDYHALYDDDSTEVIAAAVTGSRDLVPDLSRPGVKRIWAVAA